ncbi:hypothetical protein B0H13DRAFT_1901262 [Mycena leptocephala]|nr:hypothetical protein B0H13DRAFT_1901262 [Mycena leptocephala]
MTAKTALESSEDENRQRSLLSPLFLSLSLIPNDILRYSALGIASLALIYVLHLRRPSVQLSQLNDKINKTEETTFTWKKYRLISRDIADCAKGVKKIRTTVQLIAEAERQRKFTDDINVTETFLISVQCYMHQIIILMSLIFPNNPTLQSPGEKSQSCLVGDDSSFKTPH